MITHVFKLYDAEFAQLWYACVGGVGLQVDLQHGHRLRPEHVTHGYGWSGTHNWKDKQTRNP